MFLGFSGPEYVEGLFSCFSTEAKSTSLKATFSLIIFSSRAPKLQGFLTGRPPDSILSSGNIAGCMIQDGWACVLGRIFPGPCREKIQRCRDDDSRSPSQRLVRGLRYPVKPSLSLYSKLHGATYSSTAEACITYCIPLPKHAKDLPFKGDVRLGRFFK
jgi:hypothetical protein